MGEGGETLSELDFGGWADHYASQPFYGHFKDELYPVFVKLIASLRGGARVLDIGAGPGHLAVEFFAAYPEADRHFILLDSSREMLRVAARRLAGRSVQALVRSFNLKGWTKDMGPVDAIVSNNAVFNVVPERLDEFYAACQRLLVPDGFLLNQQPFGYADGESPYGEAVFPRAMRKLLLALFPDKPDLRPDALRKQAQTNRQARARHQKALAKAKAAGARFVPGQSGYHFLSVERHLESMRKAGFACGCVWRKREFAVVCGVRTAARSPGAKDA